VNVGTELSQGPFIESLKNCKSALLMLDKEASSLDRLWCLIEIYILLFDYKKILDWDASNMDILTPMGPIGSSSVKTAPVIQSISNVNTRLAKATNKGDQRQILNYIAGEPEFTGLVTEHVDGRQRLKAPKQLDPGVQNDYDKNLLIQKKEKFDMFDKKIADWAVAKRDQLQSAKSMTIVEIEDHKGPENAYKRGMSLAHLRAMWVDLRRDCRGWSRIGRATSDNDNEGNSPDSYDAALVHRALTIYDFSAEYLKKDLDTSYVERKGLPPTESEYFITVAFNITFVELMLSLEWHAEARDLPDSTVYWTWFFALSKNDIGYGFKHYKSPSNLLLHKPEVKLTGFVQVVNMSLAGALKRPNPNRELWMWLVKKEYGGDVEFDICSSTGLVSTCKPFPGGYYQHGNFPMNMASLLWDYDVDNIAPGEVTDKFKEEMTTEFNEKMPRGYRDGMAYFNIQVKKLACGPLLRELAVGDKVEKELERFDNDKMQEICALVQKTNSAGLLAPELLGVHGETPLMVASAHGNLECMEMLLRMKASVNEKDGHGETALHYAALGGQESASMLLVFHGAVPELRSMFEETALDVATRSPSSFLREYDDQGRKYVTEYKQNEQYLRILQENHTRLVSAQQLSEGLRRAAYLRSPSQEAILSPKDTRLKAARQALAEEPPVQELAPVEPRNLEKTLQDAAPPKATGSERAVAVHAPSQQQQAAQSNPARPPAGPTRCCACRKRQEASVASSQTGGEEERRYAWA
jgi:hypothetical protein